MHRISVYVNSDDLIELETVLNGLADAMLRLKGRPAMPEDELTYALVLEPVAEPPTVEDFARMISGEAIHIVLPKSVHESLDD